MRKRKQDKKIYTEVVVSEETGEVRKSTTIYKDAPEPEFVKLYVDCLFTFKGMRKGLSPIFLAFLEYMSYASPSSKYGGQVIFINKPLKLEIAGRLNLQLDSVNKALYELVKGGIFRRVDIGAYQVNPNIVGKGEWKDIKNIRATFDFAARKVRAEIIRKGEELDARLRGAKIGEIMSTAEAAPDR